MKLVIDISEKDYNNIEPFLNGEPIKGGFNLFKALEIIANGTPLPKGHGRLIDADEIIEQANNMADELDNNFTIADIEKVGTLLESISAIIEADTER